ncbi:MAG: hypothetical protein H8E31_08085, partial [Planctomycetes bacterium]|nr:hypothetical protein [Planctomycetota bacterium]
MVLRLGEATVERHLEAPARPGIYLDDFVLPDPGPWDWIIVVYVDRPRPPAGRPLPRRCFPSAPSARRRRVA